jgi:WD40 repeat protein/serine/threonine protein kinase
MAESKRTLRAIYDEASAIGAGERQAYLDRACDGDQALRANVEELLRHDESAGGFLADPKRDAPAPTPPLTERDGDRIGRYKLLQKIGEGGCGVVYMAEQTEPVRRRVALKIIKLGMDTRAVVARFEAERQALAMMDHPGIARVLDAGATDTGRPFFVMELVRGIKITDYCEQHRLSTVERLRLFIPVCQAVQHAHQKGIIHRDLKPSNVLVTSNDGVPLTKVIDFGIAKATADIQLTDKTLFTRFEMFIGTPAYMSPEQAEFNATDIDTRTDIYALGVLLYELLTGETPFDAKELMSQGIDAMRRTIREKEPVRPSTKLSRTLLTANARSLKGSSDKPAGDEEATASSRRLLRINETVALLRGDLDWIVMKCLEKDRTRRYDTANSLAADLKRHLDNEPVSVRPPSSSYRFQKLVRRNKLAFGAAGAVAVALLLGIVGSTSELVRATRAEREQSRLRALAQQAQAQAETNAERFRTTAIQSRRSQYAADMFAATAETEAGSYARARDFLREYFPRKGLEELRGFEWRYLWRLSAGQQLKTFMLSAPILDMAWSPDGHLIAVANPDGTVKLVHSASGQVVSVLTNEAVWNVSIAFSHDGKGLATAGSDDRTRFWDVQDGRLLFTVTNKMPRVACSARAPLMAIGTGGDLWAQNGEDVHLVDTKSGQALKLLPHAGDRAVFSSDGTRLATANWGPWDSGSQAVILWEVNSGQKLQVLPDVRQVVAMAFSPDDRLLAIGTRTGEIIIWDLNDFSHRLLREATWESIWALAFSPQDRVLAVAMLNQEVEIWDVGQQRQVQRLHGHAHEVRAVAFAPDGARLASGSVDGTIKLWDPHPPTVQKLIPEARLGAVGRPRFSPDNNRLSVATTNGDVQILDPKTVAPNVRMVLPNAGVPLGFSDDASILLTFAEKTRTLQRWDAASGALLSTTALDTQNGSWRIVSAAADGGRLVLATDKLIEVSETRTGQCLYRFRAPGNSDGMELSRNGQLLAIAATLNAEIRDVDARRVVRTLAGHKDRVEPIAFSPDEKTIATGSWDHTARLWDVATGKELAVLTGHKAALRSCAFSPDGRTLATGSDDRTIKFWNLATFHEVGSIQDYVPLYLAFSPDAQILMAEVEYMSHDAFLRCWRTPSLAEIDGAEGKAQRVPGKIAAVEANEEREAR